MPISPAIAHAAEDYRFNNNFLLNTVKDLQPEEWLKRPSQCANHMTWIVGHIIWARKALLSRMGTEWATPWLDLFARGAKLDEAAAYPSPDQLLTAWRDVSGVLANTLESASDELLSQPATQGPPSADGKLSGTVRFLAYHETYHVGQASYLRGLLGHPGLMG